MLPTQKNFESPTAKRSLLLIKLVFLSVFIEVLAGRALPDCLQTAEISRIASEIPNIWTDVAYRVNKFDLQEINNLISSRVNDDESKKALRMLSLYHERQGTRQKLARVLHELKQVDLSQEVLSGYFIDFDEN